MLPPRLIRRLVLAPLVVVIAATLTALTPAVAVLTVVFNLVRRRTQPDRPQRSRVLRVACLALAWSVGETAALAVLLCLWMASGFGGRLDTEPYEGRVPQIWVGASGPRMLDIAARHADGWWPAGAWTPEHYAEMLAAVRASAERAGRDPMDHQVVRRQVQ